MGRRNKNRYRSIRPISKVISDRGKSLTTVRNRFRQGHQQKDNASGSDNNRSEEHKVLKKNASAIEAETQNEIASDQNYCESPTSEAPLNRYMRFSLKNFKAFIFWAVQKSISKPSMKVAAPIKAIASNSKPTGPSEIKQKWWHKERRVSITTPKLESAICEAIKKAVPGCEDFVGVIVRRIKPKSPLDPNWTIGGVKFGKADRKTANEALTAVVERMQREFLLSDR